MESAPTRVCELLVGLPEINVLGVADMVDEMLRVSWRNQRRPSKLWELWSHRPVKERPVVELIDHPPTAILDRSGWYSAIPGTMSGPE